MSHKRNEALRHVQHSMHHVIAAGEGSDRAPDSCKLCPYYRPDFKFRTCLYAHCPYKKQVNVFRSTPEKWDILYILFLQKRDRPADIEPAWVQLGQTEDGFNINQYFVDHPEMVLGNLELESTQYGHDLTVAPIEDANLADQLTEAVQHIEGQYTAVEIAAPDVADAEVQRKTLPADPTVKNFSYTVVDGEIYYRENSIMTQIELSDNAKGRVAGMVELRQIVNELIDQQLNDFPDEDIKASQAKLNYAYDQRYGVR